MNSIIFAITQAFKSFTKRTFITILSIITITITIFVFSLFLLVAKNLDHHLEGVQKRVGVELFFKKNAHQYKINNVIEQIDKNKFVERTRFISTQEALERFKEKFGNKFLPLISQSPFPPSVQVYFKPTTSMGKEIGAFTDKWKEDESITEISGGGYLASRLSKIYKILWLGLIAWGVILVFAATIIILNTIKLTISSRENSIQIMKYVGATKKFIRRPFLYEGILNGLLSGALACGSILLLQKGLSKLIPRFFVPLSQIGLFSIVGLGVFFGAIGSRLAVRKYLKY